MTDGSRVAARALAYLERRADAATLCAVLAECGRGSSAPAVAQVARDDFEALGADALCGALEELDAFGALDGEVAAAVCARLSALQRDDGGWSSQRGTHGGAGAQDAEADDIALTGMLAGHLAKTPFVRERALAAAADFLAERFAPERLRGDAWAATAAYAHAFAMIRHAESDAILQHCGRELQRGLVTGVYDAVGFARVLVLCRAHGLPGAPLRRDELIERLCAEAREDGSFAPPGALGDADISAHTRAALRALVHLGCRL